MVKGYAANCSEKIGNCIKDLGGSEGNIILVNFITDAVKRCGYHTEQDQPSRVVFNRQGLVSPVKQDAHDCIGKKMKKLVAEFKRRKMFRCGKVRLDINCKAIDY
jgi:hypothetical protein